MAKHSQKNEAYSSNYLIDAVTQDPQGRDWLKEQIFQEGPLHKQVQHSLVLQRLDVLLNLLEVSQNDNFHPSEGTPIVLNKHDHDLELPLGFPEASLKEIKDKSSLEKLTKGPDHEIAYTALLLQAIEWMIEQAKGG